MAIKQLLYSIIVFYIINIINIFYLKYTSIIIFEYLIYLGLFYVYFMG